MYLQSTQNRRICMMKWLHGLTIVIFILNFTTLTMNINHYRINHILMVILKSNIGGHRKQLLFFQNHFINILQVHKYFIWVFWPNTHLFRWAKILSSNPITFATEVWRTKTASSNSNPSVIPQPRSPSNHMCHPFSSHTREEGSGSSYKLPTTGTKSESWPVILDSINIPQT